MVCVGGGIPGDGPLPTLERSAHFTSSGTTLPQCGSRSVAVTIAFPKVSLLLNMFLSYKYRLRSGK
jgi:hypothetical protein